MISSSGRIITSSNSGIWVSDDAGVSFTKKFTAFARYNIIQTGTGRIIVSITTGFAYSDDGGDTWTASTTFTSEPEHMLLGNNGRILAGVKSPAGVFYSDNDGDTWTQSTGIGGTYVETLGYCASNGYIYCGTFTSGTGVTMYRSSNNGASFSSHTNLSTLTQLGGKMLTDFSSELLAMWGSGTSLVVLKKSTGAWSILSTTGFPNARTLFKLSNGKLLAGAATSSGIYISTDAITFAQIYTGAYPMNAFAEYSNKKVLAAGSIFLYSNPHIKLPSLASHYLRVR